MIVFNIPLLNLQSSHFQMYGLQITDTTFSLNHYEHFQCNRMQKIHCTLIRSLNKFKYNLNKWWALTSKGPFLNEITIAIQSIFTSN